uniref:Uncharacterized protein LOC113799810 n=1 Tax=Dermatophagoides pteronyssinus TaxID=6956 RepID=A0A6P6YN27_DERPT|nr:uncharacterized protein LOC113799810 [Dermatophagoides pteronyssinus]
MNSVLNFEIFLWKKFMKNKYYRIIHNHILYLFYYDELIRQKFFINNHREKPMGKINQSSFNNKILLAITSILILIISIFSILQPKFIVNYNGFIIYTKMFPIEGLKYLSNSIIICTINIILNAFYATSSYYEQFHFILPIQYKQLRNLNHRNSKQFETIKQQSFNTLTNTLLDKPLGFRLINDMTIQANTFVTIFINISTFFFLISKQIEVNTDNF